MADKKQFRYPGIYSFSSKQQSLFFGRKQDINKLLTLIEVEAQVLLYAKSGIGKTSLLNAGVVPRLSETYLPIPIRFYAWDKDKSAPVQNILTALKNRFPEAFDKPDTSLSELTAGYNELWYAFKQIQLHLGTDKCFVLLFDQFEELFSYPAEQIEDFKNQLYEATKVNLPNPVVQQISQKRKEKASLYTRESLALLKQPMFIKPVYSIRTDRLALLDRLVDRLKNIRVNFHELLPLDEEGARQSIVGPAQAGEEFVSKNFSYTPEALEKIIRFLSENGEKSIETTQLQIICEQIEKNEVVKGGKLSITVQEIPDFKDVFRNFYLNAIARLPVSQQKQGSLLVENELIRNEQRISLDEEICKDEKESHAVLQDTLDILVDARLLRGEPNSFGRISYELAHDTLIAPIQEVADEKHIKERERQIEEKRQEELQKAREKEIREKKRREELLRMMEERAEIERSEKEKTKKRLRTTRALLTAAMIAFVLAVVGVNYAINEKKDADEARKAAIEQTIIAEIEKQNAQRSASSAQFEKNKAITASKKAEESDSLAQIETYKAILERTTADTARAKAQELADGVLTLLKRQLPAGVSDVYGYYQQQGDTSFAGGNYDEALGFYRGAILLADNTERTNRSNANLSKTQKCMTLAEKAGRYAINLQLDSAITTYKELQELNPSDPKAAWRIEAFSRPETLPMLDSLKLVLVKGGDFKMGGESQVDEKPIHKVVLSDYKIGTYEVTNSQYADFLNQYQSDTVKEGAYKGQKMIEKYKWGIQQIKGQWQASKDYENHPVVMVSWYGAYEFCRYYGLSLPTEAQWEYAARGGEHSKGFTYSGSNDPDSVAVHYSNSESTTQPEGAQPVGGKKPNELALYDMSGNVWEWCNDWYSAGYYSESTDKDPQGPLAGSLRVFRGGSWFYRVTSCRVANRHYGASYRNYFIGFRIALSL